MKAIERKESSNYLKEVKHLKKAFVILLALGLLFAMSSIAFAVQDNGSGYVYGSPKNAPISGSTKGNIVANQYDKVTGTPDKNGNGDWKEYIQGKETTNTYTPTGGDDPNASTHTQGTWNSPYTLGIDGYNYNDPQDYVADGDQYDKTGVPVTATTSRSNLVYASGPHGNYLTSTHKCRECHAVHRAAGKFKLLRSDTRFEACDWCHGTGAGSGYNIQMDNDDAYTTEYNVGHTMGFGISSGKWKAPDDTYPAFTPNYWMGGFSCFDCHSPHANPARLFGMGKDGTPNSGIKSGRTGKVYNLVNSGHDMTDVQIPGSIENDMGKNYLPAYDTDTAVLFLQYAAGSGGTGDTSIYPPTAGSTSTVDNFAGGSGYLLKTFNETTPTIFVDSRGYDPVDKTKVIADGLGVAPDGLAKPWYLAGSWLLIKNPDREISQVTSGNIESGVWNWNSASGKSAGTISREADIPVAVGGEISDMITKPLNEFSLSTPYPVNKFAIDWDTPIGMAKYANISPTFPTIVSSGVVPGFVPSDTANQRSMTNFASNIGTDADDVGKSIRNPVPYFKLFTLDEFCTDCHDGNAGRHTIKAPVFSEDRALRGQGKVDGVDNDNNNTAATNYKGSYDLAYGHDVNSRHCGGQMKFNPEDNIDAGPRCRNCHKGSSGCGVCHSNGRYVGNNGGAASGSNENSGDLWSSWPAWQSKSMYRVTQTSTGNTDTIAAGLTTSYQYPNVATSAKSITYMVKSSREANWNSNWRMATNSVLMGQKMGSTGAGEACNGDGFSWPHRTLGWKMLKDDLFGLDFNGNVIGVGEIRNPGTFFNKDMYTSHTVTLTSAQLKTHDIDSVCLDCHNPTIWNDGQVQTALGHLDDQTKDFDNKADELIQRGLP